MVTNIGSCFVPNNNNQMPIKIPLKAKHSNQTPTLSKSTIVDPEITKLSKPFLDKITVIVKPSSEADAAEMYAAFWQVSDDKTFLKSASGSKPIGGYNTSKRIMLETVVNSKHWPLLSIAYEKAKSAMKSLRFEFVPVDLGVDGMEELALATAHFMNNGWAYAVENGHISRLDIAMDLEGSTMDAFLCLQDTPTSTHYWRKDGHLESIYLGKPKGTQTVIYDRGQKRKAKSQSWKKPPTVRIEHRLKGLGLQLAKLPDLNNPFKKFSFTVNIPPMPPQAKEWQWAMFTDSVKVRGLTAALALLPEKRRMTYRKHIKQHQATWWNPEESWTHWKNMVDELRIADPNW